MQYQLIETSTGTVITQPMSLFDTVSRVAEYFGTQTVADIVKYTNLRIQRA